MMTAVPLFLTTKRPNVLHMYCTYAAAEYI